jgi:hypothetical protein
MSEPTKVRLAQALTDAGFHDLALRALIGEFDDFESDHPTPQIVLYHELATIGTPAARVFCADIRAGKFDATKEEAAAWWQREGKDI